MVRLAIFDFDGTLCDSFPWFLRVLNDVADRHGFRRVADSEIDTLRGMDSRALIRHLGVPFWKLPAIARDMRAMKAAQRASIPLFAGVDTMLAQLKAAGVVVAMVSSDSEENVRACLGQGAGHISHYACGASLFGKAALFRRVLKMSGIAAREAIAIGDEIRDIEAARKAGIAFGAVSWGYAHAAALRAHGADTLFETMDQIPARLTAPLPLARTVTSPTSTR